MTREEAIEVVKSNWPSAHYTMLAKALTVLIAHDDTIRRADKTVPMGRAHELKCEIREALRDLGLESVYAKGVADKTLDALEELETLAVTESAGVPPERPATPGH